MKSVGCPLVRQSVGTGVNCCHTGRVTTSAASGSDGASLGDPEVVLSNLDPEQQAVATTLTGPVLVVAGPGAGKTRAITHRIAYAVATGAHDPDRSVAVTFTNRAAGEMTRRLAGLGVGGVRVRTIHAAALRQLRWAWPQAIKGEMFTVMASKSSMIAQVCAEKGFAAETAVVRDLAAEIEWAKARQIGHQSYPEAAESAGRIGPPGFNPEQIGQVYAAYESAKTSAGRLDFDDVLLLTIAVLEDRPDMCERVQSTVRHFTVDEYQDITATQQRLLDLWLGDGDDICVVGDPNQTIYTFAGADPGAMRRFRQHYPQAAVVHLSRSYRCSPRILEVARSVAPAEVNLRSMQPEGAAVVLRRYPDETAEARSVAAAIERTIQAGTPARNIAILVRIHALTAPFEAELARRRIPYSVRGDRRYFDRPEVRRAVSVLRAALRSTSAASGGPNPDPGLADTKETVTSLVRVLLEPLGYSATPPAGLGHTRSEWESLAALVGMVDELARNSADLTLAGVVDELARRHALDYAPGVDGVTIATMHAAKGLEWPVVYVPCLADGIVPLRQVARSEALDEERRLLYVAITRAARTLELSWSRGNAGRSRHRDVSRFLTALPIVNSR